MDSNTSQQNAKMNHLSSVKLIRFAILLIGLLLLMLPLIVGVSFLVFNFNMSKEFRLMWSGNPHTSYFFILCGFIGAYILVNFKSSKA
jgi:hypothetical protein